MSIFTRYEGGLLYSMIGQPGRRRHRSKMIFELGGSRHVHHRRQHHEPVGAEAFGIAGETHRRGRREFRDARNDRHLAFGASTAAFSTLRFSSALKELPSPTVPINTRP